MLARIIASVAKAEFYEISGPQIFSKWVGESEAVLRRIFEDAAKQERSIIFFDEIDSVAPQRASDANEASRRVVAQLLTQMDGFKPEQNVMVIAATNRAGDLDEALRRPGRFDWEVEFPLPDLEDREEILRVSAANLRTAHALPHDDIASKTAGWSSAELSAIWSEAALLAVADGRDLIMDDDYYGGFERVAGHRRRLTPESHSGSLP
jgi:transitional endoplasmic reticulum ATPase